MNDILLIDKPAGITSFGVVARVRRHLSDLATAEYNAQNPHHPIKRKKVKVGHTGTLDPFATGLLILLTGSATKRASEFLKLDKIYEATLRLGATSTTGDPEGEITYASEKFGNSFSGEFAGYDRDLARRPRNDGRRRRDPEKLVPELPSVQQIKTTLRHFTGPLTQTPPAFSAIKINGRRAYNLARQGKPVELPQRQIEIYSIELLSYNYPELKIRTHVSSGTYIRTLATDIGVKLGTGAYLTALRRTRVGNYDIKDATKLDDSIKSPKI